MVLGENPLQFEMNLRMVVEAYLNGAQPLVWIDF